MLRPLALLSLLAFPALAGPKWSQDPDKADAQGHVFTCEGEGKTEEDALAAALGLCNDKICKVCGVEVESIVETKETLTGVDFQRKVIERCRRVRRGETVPRYKSSECGPDGCQAWVQLLYSKADEKAECSRYQQEDFADPAACEKEIDQFRHLEGRSAESFRKRTRLLDAALIHCDKIDVRPTPAIMALDEKLRAGMDLFEFTGKLQNQLADQTEGWTNSDRFGAEKSARQEAIDDFRPLWGWYLATYEPLRQQIAESKLLTQRIKLVRDLVANKALLFEVLEAAQDKTLDSPEGVARLAKALEAMPVGGQYGSPDVHFAILGSLERTKTDTQAIQAWFRRAYPPDKLQRTAYPSNLISVFASDHKVSAEEWDWGFVAAREFNCALCVRMLLAVRDHGSFEIRAQRLLAAIDLGVQQARKAPDTKALQRIFRNVAPTKDPGFLLAVEPKLPEGVRAGFEWDYWKTVIERFEEEQPEADQRAWLLRTAREAGATPAGGETESTCRELDSRWKMLEEHDADDTPLYGRACACLSGPLAHESRSSKWELLERAYDLALPCAKVPGSAVPKPEPRQRRIEGPTTQTETDGACPFRELRPPRVIVERPYATLRRPVSNDWFDCVKAAGGELNVKVLLQQKGKELAQYHDEKVKSPRMEERAWLSDFCGRDPFQNTTAVQFVLTGTGAAAKASWTSPLVPLRCPCKAENRSTLVVKATPTGLSVESSYDPEWLKCHASGAAELRLFAAPTQDQAAALIIPTAIVGGLQKAPVKTIVPKSKLCSGGTWVRSELWGTGELSDERQKGEDATRLDCK